uniref:LexA repressor n=1 Tax=candidate division WOR-3 bacterium TaxID=2052148 RepID=A0A7C6A960_UNCW3
MFTTEEKIINFLRDWFKDRNYSPSIREIGKGVGLKSTKAVKYHLDNLVAKGKLTRKSFKARTLKLKESLSGLPLVGRIAAGTPVLAVENIEEYISLDAQFAGCFLLRVSGDSMREAGIFDQDLVIVRPQPTANNGDIVVALLDDSATVKRFYQKGGRILLKPENPRYPIIIVKRHERLTILGIVVGGLKRYK